MARESKVRALIIGLLSAGKPLTSGEINKAAISAGFSALAGKNCTHKLAAAGEIGARKQGQDVLYFISQAAADSFPAEDFAAFVASRHSGRKARAKVNGEPGQFRRENVSARWTAGPSAIKPQKMAQEVDYSRAKVTIAPTVRHDDRYQCAPGSTPYGLVLAAEWRELRGGAGAPFGELRG